MIMIVCQKIHKKFNTSTYFLETLPILDSPFSFCFKVYYLKTILFWEYFYNYRHKTFKYAKSDLHFTEK